MRGEGVIFEFSEKTRNLRAQVEAFMEELVYPNEAKFHEQLGAAESRWSVPPVMEELKEEAKARGLWNLFLPDSDLGAGLTNLEYASLCEVKGRSPIAPEAFNCNAPDTGNMEVLVRYGTEVQNLDLHGQDRPGRAAPRAAVNDPGPPRYARRKGRTDPPRLRLRRRPPWARGDLLR